jgi:hypothetical protein
MAQQEAGLVTPAPHVWVATVRQRFDLLLRDQAGERCD